MKNRTHDNYLADLAHRLNGEHEKAADAVRRGTEHAIAAGKLLIEAKGMLAHGGWLPWLQEHFAGSERTAQLYMRLAKKEPALRRMLDAKSATVADFTIQGAAAAMAEPEAMAADDACQLLYDALGPEDFERFREAVIAWNPTPAEWRRLFTVTLPRMRAERTAA